MCEMKARVQLVNEPFQAARWYIGGDCPKSDCPKNEQLAEKRSFEGNCEILSQRHYPPIYQQARKRFIYFIAFRLIYTMYLSMYLGKLKRKMHKNKTHMNATQIESEPCDCE